MSTRFTDYEEARKFAQKRADEMGIYHRLEALTEYGYGVKGFNVHMIPNPDKQFGRDLEGEAIIPVGKAYCV